MPFLDLVFSGGGTRGVALAGAMEVVQNHRPLPAIRRLVGTSAGAVSATLITTGFLTEDFKKMLPAKAGEAFELGSFFAPPKAAIVRDAVRQKDSETRKLLRGMIDNASDKLVQQLGERRPVLANMLANAVGGGKQGFYDAAFQGFLDHLEAADNDPNNPHFFRAAFFSLLEFGGLFDPELFRVWLAERIRAKWSKFTPATTFKEFHAMTWIYGNRELSVVVADTTDAKPLVLNQRTAPDCPLVDAVRASMSLPLVWPEVIWDRKWGPYLGRDISGHTLSDGSILANLGIKYVTDWDDPDVRQIMGEPDKPPHTVIALLLDASLPVAGEAAPAEGKPPPKVVSQIIRLFDTMGAWQHDTYKGKEELICRIPVKGFPALELQRTQDTVNRLQTLINSGRCAMTEYLKKRNI
ncbi:MAG TPA: patatin-like phospholipase family protein [Gemmataceae bacterium]|jgi:predicted acylesterase/phospholipase RssA|nr:patatin-like phospholipase family protein [Gemmataceae bacterium]